MQRPGQSWMDPGLRIPLLPALCAPEEHDWWGQRAIIQVLFPRTYKDGQVHHEVHKYCPSPSKAHVEAHVTVLQNLREKCCVETASPDRANQPQMTHVRQ